VCPAASVGLDAVDLAWVEVDWTGAVKQGKWIHSSAQL